MFHDTVRCSPRSFRGLIFNCFPDGFGIFYPYGRVAFWGLPQGVLQAWVRSQGLGQKWAQLRAPRFGNVGVQTCHRLIGPPAEASKTTNDRQVNQKYIYYDLTKSRYGDSFFFICGVRRTFEGTDGGGRAGRTNCYKGGAGPNLSPRTSAGREGAPKTAPRHINIYIYIYIYIYLCIHSIIFMICVVIFGH